MVDGVLRTKLWRFRNDGVVEGFFVAWEKIFWILITASEVRREK